MQINEPLQGVLWYYRDMKVKKKTRGQLVKELDRVFSIYIRRRHGDDATCVTCGITKPWKQMQAGHFYTRGRYPTRWHEDNVHVQCYRCNVLLKGNYISYTKYMINRYGMEYVDSLEIASNSPGKITTPTIIEMIEHYTNASNNTKTSEVTIDNTPWGVI